MPNQNFVDPREMASCDLSLSYNSKCHEKICRFSYTSWCPTCDKESPRRRCRSESLEPCRRRGREMKSFSPRKYEKNREYENMDLDYETKDFRLDSCRIRSNLCELPTTYISNNCQMAKVASDCQNDYTDSSEKTLKIYENTFKPFDVHNQALNFGSMPEKQDKDHRLHPKGEECCKNSHKNVYKYNSKIEHVRPHFPKSADCYRPPQDILKTNSTNGFCSKNREDLVKEFISKTRTFNCNNVQPYQPFKNSKEVYNKLLEAEAKNAHVVNKINLIESFKTSVDNEVKRSLHSGHENKNTDNESGSQSYENHRSPYTHSEYKRTSNQQLNFGAQKSLFEKQINRLEELKTQLENQKSLLEHQKAYFEQVKMNEKSHSLLFPMTNLKSQSARQPIKLIKTTVGGAESPTNNVSNVHYLTSTYFDSIKDTAGLKERYLREIEMLKSRMVGLQVPKSGSQNETGCAETVKNQDTSNTNQDIHPRNRFVNSGLDANYLRCRIENIGTKNFNKIGNKKETKKDRLKSTSKVSLKTKKLNSVKLKKTKNKISSGLSSCSDLSSECSDSEISVKAEPDNPENTKSEESEFKVESVSSAEFLDESEEKGEGDGNACWPVRHSLFPHIPPYIRFNIHDSEQPFKLPKGRRYLKWKLSTITPILVRKTLMNTGFRLVRSEFTRESNDWVGTWGKHMKSPMFKTLKENQKLNHFPGTFQIGRKDRLWRNLQRLMVLHGHKEFGFIPQTYVLPQELKLLKQHWKNGSEDEKWIIKPPASARGTGIRVIHKWSQLPKRSNLIVQQYISDPYLINGNKFDLRLYVLVTSYNPLRIYLYPDGLARFASVQYSDSAKDLKDRYMHLTNYSINKYSSNYTANDDANSCQGHKWTLSKLWEYLGKRNVDIKSLWKDLQQLVIKTLISGESAIVPLGKENMNSRYNCYELFGIDVLLDNRMKPWLLEVNISPSLHSQSSLDAHVKGPMVQSLFNLAQFHLPWKLSKHGCTLPCYEPKLYSVYLTKKELNKHLRFSDIESREYYLKYILDDLTGDDVRHLTQAEDELTVIGNFERIFPTASTYKYFQYMEPRYYNRLFDAWETKYEKNRKPGISLLQGLCSTKMHLKVASPPKTTYSLPSMIPGEQQLNQNTETSNLQNLLPSKEGHSHPMLLPSVQVCSLGPEVIRTCMRAPIVTPVAAPVV